MSQLRKMLITGGAGCLGSNLVAHYLVQGYEILVIDNFATGKPEALPKNEKLTVVEGSIADESLIKNIIKKFQPTQIVHSAASYKDPTDLKEDVRTNILGMINLIEAANEHTVDRFINFQTALCYGRPVSVPISVDASTAPFTSYGISKTAAEQLLQRSKLPFVSLRLANICGPRLSIGPIPTFYQRLLENKDCYCTDSVRDFIDMSDFLTLMDLVLCKSAPTGTFNVSTGIGHSILDIFHRVSNYLGKGSLEVPITPVSRDDVQSVVLDPSFTEVMFGWKAKIGFNQMIDRQLKWYDKYGVKEVYSHLEIVDQNS